MTGPTREDIVAKAGELGFEDTGFTTAEPFDTHLDFLKDRQGMSVIEYFKNQAEETGIPYQNLINLYLRDCVRSNRKLSINWTQ